MNWIQIIDALTILNSALLVAIAISVGIWTRANQVGFLNHRARLEQSVLHLEKELAELKAGSIIQLPPVTNGPLA